MGLFENKDYFANLNKQEKELTNEKIQIEETTIRISVEEPAENSNDETVASDLLLTKQVGLKSQIFHDASSPQRPPKNEQLIKIAVTFLVGCMVSQTINFNLFSFYYVANFGYMFIFDVITILLCTFTLGEIWNPMLTHLAVILILEGVHFGMSIVIYNLFKSEYSFELKLASWPFYFIDISLFVLVLILTLGQCKHQPIKSNSV